MTATLRLGLIGLSVTLGLNVFGLLVLGQPAARFLASEWWSVWFPSFVVWISIATMGLSRHHRLR